MINASGKTIELCYFPTKHEEIKSRLVSISHPAVVMPTRAFISVGGYRKTVVDAEDYDLWLRISDRFLLANVASVVLKYRNHPQQVSVRKLRRQLLSCLGARAAALSRSRGRIRWRS
jgi:glycosyl transferase family 2